MARGVSAMTRLTTLSLLFVALGASKNRVCHVSDRCEDDEAEQWAQQVRMTELVSVAGLASRADVAKGIVVLRALGWPRHQSCLKRSPHDRQRGCVASRSLFGMEDHSQ